MHYAYVAGGCGWCAAVQTEVTHPLLDADCLLPAAWLPEQDPPTILLLHLRNLCKLVIRSAASHPMSSWVFKAIHARWHLLSKPACMCLCGTAHRCTSCCTFQLFICYFATDALPLCTAILRNLSNSLKLCKTSRLYRLSHEQMKRRLPMPCASGV